jgi:periplasmic divalent cation tolerance protein
MTEACVILTTTDSDEEARRLARALVELRLAACVQRLDIGSVYTWEGAVEEAREILLLVKTTVERRREAEDWILRNHHYQVPEVVSLRADGASNAYLEWMSAATRAGDAAGRQ